MALRPLPVKTLADEVERRLLAHIRERGLVPGDALPGELELAVALGVSRNVVREAVSRLRMIGLIESRRRRGMVLGRPDILRGLSRVLDAAAVSPDDALDLIRLRIVLETGMTELVHAGRNPAALARLERQVIRLERAKTWRQRVAADAAFHAELFGMTGSPLLARFQALLQAFFERSRHLFGDEPHRRSAGREHRQIFTALRDGTVEEFTLAVRQHLAIYGNIISERSMPCNQD